MKTTREILKQINNAIINNNKPRERKYLYASDIYGCQRKIAMQFKGNQKSFDARTLRIFDNGNSTHERIEKYFLNAGMLIESEKVLPNFVDEIEVHGRLDLLLKIDNEKVIGEIKSINLRNVETPKREHKAQLMFYMHQLNIKKGLLIYESKQTQELFLFELDYDELKAKKVIDWFKETDKKMRQKRLPKKMNQNYYPCKFGKGECQYFEDCHLNISL